MLSRYGLGLELSSSVADIWYTHEDFDYNDDDDDNDNDNEKYVDDIGGTRFRNLVNAIVELQQPMEHQLSVLHNEMDFLTYTFDVSVVLDSQFCRDACFCGGHITRRCHVSESAQVQTLENYFMQLQTWMRVCFVASDLEALHPQRKLEQRRIKVPRRIKSLHFIDAALAQYRDFVETRRLQPLWCFIDEDKLYSWTCKEFSPAKARQRALKQHYLCDYLRKRWIASVGAQLQHAVRYFDTIARLPQ